MIKALSRSSVSIKRSFSGKTDFDKSQRWIEKTQGSVITGGEGLHKERKGYGLKHGKQEGWLGKGLFSVLRKRQ